MLHRCRQGTSPKWRPAPAAEPPPPAPAGSGIALPIIAVRKALDRADGTGYEASLNDRRRFSSVVEHPLRKR
jgi:hypothetical protein